MIWLRIKKQNGIVVIADTQKPTTSKWMVSFALNAKALCGWRCDVGKFDFEIPTDFIKQLGRLADVDRIAPQMIDEAMPILEGNLKKELAKHKRTSTMLDSVKKTKAGKNKYGYFATVRPTGMSKVYMDNKGVIRQRKEPVRNMEILAHLEYGTSNQDPKPVLTKAIKDSENAVLNKMQEVFDREVGR